MKTRLAAAFLVATIASSSSNPSAAAKPSELLDAWDGIASVRVSVGAAAPRLACTAANIAPNVWVTAAHCFENPAEPEAFLKTHRGQTAAIVQIVPAPSGVDLAVIRVNPGIEAKPFELASNSAEAGQELILTGSGRRRPYGLPLRITGSEAQVEVAGTHLRQVYISEATGAERACTGDSGAPVHLGRTLYAVHVAGATNPGCKGSTHPRMWHTDLVPSRAWIQTVTDELGASSEQPTQSSRLATAEIVGIAISAVALLGLVLGHIAQLLFA